MFVILTISKEGVMHYHGPFAGREAITQYAQTKQLGSYISYPLADPVAAKEANAQGIRYYDYLGGDKWKELTQEEYNKGDRELGVTVEKLAEGHYRLSADTYYAPYGECVLTITQTLERALATYGAILQADTILEGGNKPSVASSAKTPVQSFLHTLSYELHNIADRLDKAGRKE